MAKEQILIIDDEEDILELVKYNLSKDGFSILTAATGEEGLKIARLEHPDLIILDLMLPGIDGLDVCKLLKNDMETRGIPIVMLTAKGDEADIVAGLELGADDFIVKPFSPKVLSARVKSVLRRNRANDTAEDSIVRIDNLVIDPGKHQITLDGELLDLTFTEFKILHLLARQRGYVFTRYQIVDSVHGEDYPVTDRSVDVQIVGLRRKLGNFGDMIETVRGVGYRIKG